MSNNISIIKKEECCGCSACVACCNVNAIQMIPDEKGFLFPYVNDACISCGACVKVCNSKVFYNNCISGFAVKNKNKQVLKKSSSGGISHALCSEIIRNNGVVYGVAYDDDYKVITKRAETILECEAFFGSKYVQTDPKDSFNSVFADLKAGRSVLFFGTSCHVAGLYSFLRSRKCQLDKLYTVDLICHGVPSPKLFEEYITFLKKDRKGFKDFSFRTKEYPWGYGSKNFGCTIYWNNGKKEVDTAKSKIYLKLFFSNNCLRDYCHSCPFAGINKPADLTIADYWGCDKEHPEFFDNNGVSAVLVQTEKGQKLLDSLRGIDALESTIEKIKNKQGNLNSASLKNSESEKFWEYYRNNGFIALAKKYGDYYWKGKLKSTRLFNTFDRIRTGIPHRFK